MLLCLHWLAHGRGTVELGDDYGIGNASVARIKRAFLYGMITKFSPTLDPTSEHWIGLAIQHQPPFSRIQNQAFIQVVGAGDGVHIKLKTHKTSPLWRSGRKCNAFSPQLTIPPTVSFVVPSRPTRGLSPRSSSSLTCR